MAIVDDLAMLALSIAIAAVALVCFMVGLYLWVLRRRREAEEAGTRASPVTPDSGWQGDQGAIPRGPDRR